MTARIWRLLPVVALTLGCPKEAPVIPLGEALIIVDTDMPVPVLASRMRVDFYTQTGTWYGSRDLALGKLTQWPASFSVYLPNGQTETRVIVRLRAFPSGHTRDYRGERFADVVTSCDDASCKTSTPAPCCPQIIPAEPKPITSIALDPALTAPSTEPEPEVTVDRLLALDLVDGSRGAVRVVLHGACAGTMADLRDFSHLSTCIDTERTRASLGVSTLDADMTLPTTSVAGAFGADAAASCVTPRAQRKGADGTNLYDDEVCVPGGPMIFGGRDGFVGDTLDSLPERVAIVPSFLMDRYEVTVGRFRQALREGFTTHGVAANDGPLGTAAVAPSDPSMCTGSTTPLGREVLPLTCVSLEAAKSFCKFYGGTLPTEAQWEYAAAVAARRQKTFYPWGDAAPTCRTVVFDRGAPGTDLCLGAGVDFGPAFVAAPEQINGDNTPSVGIVGLAGNVAELVLDDVLPFSSNCWRAAPQRSPSCIKGLVNPGSRGGTWASDFIDLIAERRTEFVAANAEVGFRCVRRADGAPP